MVATLGLLGLGPSVAVIVVVRVVADAVVVGVHPLGGVHREGVHAVAVAVVVAVGVQAAARLFRTVEHPVVVVVGVNVVRNAVVVEVRADGDGQRGRIVRAGRRVGRDGVDHWAADVGRRAPQGAVRRPEVQAGRQVWRHVPQHGRVTRSLPGERLHRAVVRQVEARERQGQRDLLDRLKHLDVQHESRRGARDGRHRDGVVGSSSEHRRCSIDGPVGRAEMKPKRQAGRDRPRGRRFTGRLSAEILHRRAVDQGQVRGREHQRNPRSWDGDVDLHGERTGVVGGRDVDARGVLNQNRRTRDAPREVVEGQAHRQGAAHRPRFHGTSGVDRRFVHDAVAWVPQAVVAAVGDVRHRFEDRQFNDLAVAIVPQVAHDDHVMRSGHVGRRRAHNAAVGQQGQAVGQGRTHGRREQTMPAQRRVVDDSVHAPGEGSRGRQVKPDGAGCNADHHFVAEHPSVHAHVQPVRVRGGGGGIGALQASAGGREGEAAGQPRAAVGAHQRPRLTQNPRAAGAGALGKVRVSVAGPLIAEQRQMLCLMPKSGGEAKHGRHQAVHVSTVVIGPGHFDGSLHAGAARYAERLVVTEMKHRHA